MKICSCLYVGNHWQWDHHIWGSLTLKNVWSPLVSVIENHATTESAEQSSFAPVIFPMFFPASPVFSKPHRLMNPFSVEQTSPTIYFSIYSVFPSFFVCLYSVQEIAWPNLKCSGRLQCSKWSSKCSATMKNMSLLFR